jgi:hypothetical protein
MITFKYTQNAPSGGWGLHMNILLITAFLLGSCNTKDPIATPIDSPDYSIIDGDTVKTVVNYDKTLKGKFYYDNNLICVGDTIIIYKEPKLHIPPAKDPDLSKIKNNLHPDLKGKSLQMIAIGGSLTAGVRDGGYFNEGMLTSYPNLIARQMKLKKFELPLFDKQEYNGTIRRLRTAFNPTGGPFTKYNIVKNNSGIKKNDNNINTKKYVGDADNLAVPYFDRVSLKGRVSFSNSEKNAVFSRIVIDDKYKTVSEKIVAKKFDFFILESGLDNLMDSPGAGAFWDDYTFKDDLTSDERIRMSPELSLIRNVIVPINAKGVLLNVPDLLDLPYFVKTEFVKNYVLNDPYLKDEFSRRNFTFENIAAFLPSSKLDSLLSPKVHISLKPIANTLLHDFLTISSNLVTIQNSVKNSNTQLQSFNKRYGYPIVDIQTLYKKIANDGFMTDGGINVNVDNFYSSDRINPSAFGQAVIANEVIKVINVSYKMDIPLIDLSEYLNTK